jgi:hypothetical protein
MSTDRLRSLEDALPVAQHLVATMADLRAWLDEIDAEIRSIDILSDTSSEQVKKQIDNAKVCTLYYQCPHWVDLSDEI